MRPAPGVHRRPDVVALKQLNRFDAGLAAFASFEHGLHGFEGVEVHAVEPAHADHDGFFDALPEGHVHLRQTPGDGHGCPRHEREVQPLCCLHHLLGFVVAERELLVVEVGDGMLFGLEDLCALLEEVEAREQNLPFVVGRIRELRALLDDGEDGVDGDSISAAAESVRDIARQAEAELLGARVAQVSCGGRGPRVRNLRPGAAVCGH